MAAWVAAWVAARVEARVAAWVAVEGVEASLAEARVASEATCRVAEHQDVALEAALHRTGEGVAGEVTWKRETGFLL